MADFVLTAANLPQIREHQPIQHGLRYAFLVGPWQAHVGRIHHADSFVDSWAVVHGEEAPCVTWRADPNLPAYERRLDYCFVSGRLAQYVRRAWIDLEAEGSDHYPYWVEMEI